MISSIHGQKLVICNWTGESFESEKRFKIPKYKRSAGAVEWEGCYSSPGAAIAALTARNKADNLSPEQHEECVQVFQASLRRTPDHTLDKFTIKAAPMYTELKRFGGEMTIEAFQKQYDHQKQVTLFYQDIKCRSFVDVDVEVDDEADGSGPEMTAAAARTELEHRAAVAKFIKEDDARKASLASNAPKKWFHTTFVPGTAPASQEKTNVPRGTTGVIGWLREKAKNTRHPQAVVLYLHPTYDNLFAVGLPEHWQEQGNKGAADALAKTTVFGPVELFHKFANRGKRAAPAAAAAAAGDAAPTDVESVAAEPLKKKIKRSPAVADLSKQPKEAPVPVPAPAVVPPSPMDATVVVPETQPQQQASSTFSSVSSTVHLPTLATRTKACDGPDGLVDPLDFFN